MKSLNMRNDNKNYKYSKNFANIVSRTLRREAVEMETGKEISEYGEWNTKGYLNAMREVLANWNFFAVQTLDVA